jgi:hypothetical protein
MGDDLDRDVVNAGIVRHLRERIEGTEESEKALQSEIHMAYGSLERARMNLENLRVALVAVNVEKGALVRRLVEFEKYQGVTE